MNKDIARTVKTYTKDAVLIEEGSPATSEIFYLYRGTCLAEINGKVVGKIESGEFFGEVAAMLQTHRTATVRAATDCTVFVFKGLDDQNLYEVISKDPKIIRKFSEQMAIRLVEANRRAAQEVEKSGTQIEKLRKTVSGAIFVGEKIVEKFPSKMLQELVEFLKASGGIPLGKKEDVDERYFPNTKNLFG
jgi:CRP-like cAMP-binding protein